MPTPVTDTPPLGLAARKGFLWQALAFGLARLVLLASTIVLARVLGPADFGLVSLAVTIVMALTVVSDVGVSQALVYLPRSERRIDVAALTALSGSAALALVWLVAAPWTALWLGDPSATPMLRALAVVLVLSTLGEVPDAVLRKELRFSRRLPGELSRGLARGVVAITLALAGAGAWSLVLAEIVGATAFAVVAWAMVGHRAGPWRSWLDRRELRELLVFGVPAAANGALATLVLNVDYVVVASVLGTTALGVYVVGFRLPELLVISVFQVFSQVTYPVYTYARESPERLRRAYLLSLRVQATYGLAAGAGIAVAAPILVPVLFGPRYSGALPVMQAIACYTVFRSVAVGAVDVFKAVGRPQLGVWLGAGRLVVLVPVLLVGTRWGVTGVAVAQAMLALVFALVTQRMVSGVLGLRGQEVLRALRTPLLAGAASAAGAGAVVLLVADPSWWSVGLAAATVAGCAAAALWLADRGLVRKVVRG